MSTNQSSNGDAIKAAQTRHNRIFGAYVLILVLTVLGTYLVWNSGNKVQEAIQADASARIEEAKQGVKKLENDNLKLGGDLETEKGKVAGLQKAATDAKAAQQKVETDLAKQQERTAIAERALLELQRRVEPRRISSDQKARLVGILKTGPKGEVIITCVMGDGEGNAFAQQVADVLNEAGWPHAGVDQSAYSGGNPVGFGIVVHSAITAPPYAAALQRAFFSVGLPLGGAENGQLPEGKVEILVGNKSN